MGLLSVYKLDRGFAVSIREMDTWLPRTFRAVAGSVWCTDGTATECGTVVEVYNGRESVNLAISLGDQATVF